MKQLGNLAIVVAKHPEVMMQIYDEKVCVHTGSGTERKTLSCNVWDDNYINGIIAYLNFGTTTEDLRRDLLCCNELVAPKKSVGRTATLKSQSRDKQQP